MRIAPPRKALTSAVLSLIFFVVLVATASAQRSGDYEEVSQQWIQKALTKIPLNDPRADTDQFLPVVSFSQEIIQAQSFQEESLTLLNGSGWQIVGGVVDLIIQDNSSTYVLYGRRNLSYQSGLWNNRLNSEQSYEDYLVIHYKNNQKELLIHQKLQPTTAQILIGLQLNDENNGFEVVQNSVSGKPQILWSYSF